MTSTASRSELIAAAYELFRENGYADTTLEDLARNLKSDLPTVQAQFHNKKDLFSAVLQAYSPLDDFKAAMTEAHGETAEDIIREAVSRMVEAAENHMGFFQLALVDAEMNHGASLSTLSVHLAPSALSLLSRIKRTGQLRPISDVILARTLIAMVIGFIGSERAMPQVGKLAMRLIPQRAWLDGMIDLILYGLLEDDQR